LIWRATFVVAGLLLWGAPATAAPRQPVANAARVELASLGIASEASAATYERVAFGSGWSSQGGCRDTRAVVLARSSSSAVTYAAGGCTVAGGDWWSSYDGTRHVVAGELDVDHLVPLEEAWTSGAASWDRAARVAYANDLRPGHLVAVSASLNRSKGARDVAEWRPPASAASCQYAIDWIQVKFRWHLSVDDAERRVLEELLGSC
jgi:hypothetical protein